MAEQQNAGQPPGQDIEFERKNILVTGGAGFIGSHLCERLLKDGHRVICVDNFITSNVRNIDGLLQLPDFKFIRLDVNEPFDLERHAELAPLKLPFQGIQEIYHLACPTSIKSFDEYKIDTLKANSLGNYNVLELARKYRAKIMLASSSVIYGSRTEDDPYKEEEELGVVDHLTPRACYDEGKRFSETMFETYRQVHGLETRIARLFRTYGPRMMLDDGHMIPDFVMNALDGKDLEILGDDSFKTSLVYVTDVVDGMVRLMDAPSGIGPVNFGSDEDLRIADVAQRIIEMTGSDSKITYNDTYEFLTYLGLPRIQRAKDLGWLPLVRLESGLQKTIEYIKANKLLLSSV